jgi:hypothetical protein
MTSAYDDRPADERRLEGKPVSELVSDALQQLSRLLRNEVALARAEVSNKAKGAMRGGAMLGAAAIVALPSLVILMLALAALMIELGVAASLSCLITSVIGFVIAGILAKVGLNRLRADVLIPNRTITQLRRDAATMKEHI